METTHRKIWLHQLLHLCGDCAAQKTGNGSVKIWEMAAKGQAKLLSRCVGLRKNLWGLGCHRPAFALSKKTALPKMCPRGGAGTADHKGHPTEAARITLLLISLLPSSSQTDTQLRFEGKARFSQHWVVHPSSDLSGGLNWTNTPNKLPHANHILLQLLHLTDLATELKQWGSSPGLQKCHHPISLVPWKNVGTPWKTASRTSPRARTFSCI